MDDDVPESSSVVPESISVVPESRGSRVQLRGSRVQLRGVPQPESSSVVVTQPEPEAPALMIGPALTPFHAFRVIVPAGKNIVHHLRLVGGPLSVLSGFGRISKVKFAHRDRDLTPEEGLDIMTMDGSYRRNHEGILILERLSVGVLNAYSYFIVGTVEESLIGIGEVEIMIGMSALPDDNNEDDNNADNKVDLLPMTLHHIVVPAGQDVQDHLRYFGDIAASADGDDRIYVINGSGHVSRVSIRPASYDDGVNSALSSDELGSYQITALHGRISRDISRDGDGLRVGLIVRGGDQIFGHVDGSIISVGDVTVTYGVQG